MSECCGGGKTRLLYSCSGCSDVGEVADKGDIVAPVTEITDDHIENQG